MRFLKTLAKNMKRAARTLDDSREVLDGAGACLQSGAELARTASAQMGEAVKLGQHVGRELIDGARKLATPATPAPVKIDVRVTSVKTNGK